MDFIKDDPKKLYGKYLASSMCSAMVLSIYGFVDSIAVGKSEGAVGAAAMAVLTPMFGMIIFLAILVGIGGSVLMTNARGEGKQDKADSYFTASVILMSIMTVIGWTVFSQFSGVLFTLLGAKAELIPKIMEYARWIIRFFPVFIMPSFMSSFIRNDGAPALAMAAVIAGGCTNMFLDWYLVFPLGMGMEGAAIATVTGTVLQVMIMCTHFFSKKCRLRLVRPRRLLYSAKNILYIGFGAGVIDLGTVTLSIIINNQIMRYAGTAELAVYGVIVTATQLLQALFSGVGQAIQPTISANYGAKRYDRIAKFLRMALITVTVMGAVMTAAGELFPAAIMRLFVDLTPELESASPLIVRMCFAVFVPLGINIMATYYLQSTMHGKMSTAVSVMRSIAVSGVLIMLLPLVMGINGVWLAIPLAEFAVAAIAAMFMKRCSK